MSIQLEIDEKGFSNFQKQLDILKDNGRKSLYWAIVKIAMQIKNTAQIRLTGRGHVDSGRLRASIFVQAKNISNVTRNPKNQLTYSDNEGKTYDSQLRSVQLNDDEIAVGTNVEYASSIERGSRPHIIKAINAKALNTPYGFFKQVNHPGFGGDSFLYWALKNVDVEESIAKAMRNDIKYGSFLKKGFEKTGSALTDKDL